MQPSTTSSALSATSSAFLAPSGISSTSSALSATSVISTSSAQPVFSFPSQVVVPDSSKPFSLPLKQTKAIALTASSFHFKSSTLDSTKQTPFFQGSSTSDHETNVTKVVSEDSQKSNPFSEKSFFPAKDMHKSNTVSKQSEAKKSLTSSTVSSDAFSFKTSLKQSSRTVKLEAKAVRSSPVPSEEQPKPKSSEATKDMDTMAASNTTPTAVQARLPAQSVKDEIEVVEMNGNSCETLDSQKNKTQQDVSEMKPELPKVSSFSPPHSSDMDDKQTNLDLQRGETDQKPLEIRPPELPKVTLFSSPYLGGEEKKGTDLSTEPVACSFKQTYDHMENSIPGTSMLCYSLRPPIMSNIQFSFSKSHNFKTYGKRKRPTRRGIRKPERTLFSSPYLGNKEDKRTHLDLQKGKTDQEPLEMMPSELPKVTLLSSPYAGDMEEKRTNLDLRNIKTQQEVLEIEPPQLPKVTLYSSPYLSDMDDKRINLELQKGKTEWEAIEIRPHELPKVTLFSSPFLGDMDDKQINLDLQRGKSDQKRLEIKPPDLPKVTLFSSPYPGSKEEKTTKEAVETRPPEVPKVNLFSSAYFGKEEKSTNLLFEPVADTLKVVDDHMQKSVPVTSASCFTMYSPIMSNTQFSFSNTYRSVLHDQDLTPARGEKRKYFNHDQKILNVSPDYPSYKEDLEIMPFKLQKLLAFPTPGIDDSKKMTPNPTIQSFSGTSEMGKHKENSVIDSSASVSIPSTTISNALSLFSSPFHCTMFHDRKSEQTIQGKGSTNVQPQPNLPFGLPLYPTKRENAAAMAMPELDPLTEFFICMARTAKTFPVENQIRIKAQIFEIINSMEMALVNEVVASNQSNNSPNHEFEKK